MNRNHVISIAPPYFHFAIYVIYIQLREQSVDFTGIFSYVQPIT